MLPHDLPTSVEPIELTVIEGYRVPRLTSVICMMRVDGMGAERFPEPKRLTMRLALCGV